jgi:hypothetical protein
LKFSGKPIFNTILLVSPLNPWIEVHNATHIRGGVGFAAFEG